MRKKSIVSACLAIIMLLMGGCGNMEGAAGKEVNAGDAVVLKDPAVAVAGVLTEAASRRNIYLADVYEASVYPEVTEYAYEKSQRFEAFGKVMGEKVEPGEVLVYANSDSIDAKVESFQTRLDNLRENYEEYVQETTKEIEEAGRQMIFYEDILDDMQDIMPTDEGAPDYAARYAAWEKENEKWQGQYNWYDFVAFRGEERLRQEKEVFQLDYAYYSTQLESLLEQQEATKLVADVSGTVVAAMERKVGQSMTANTPVVAVAHNDGAKYLKCDYIYRLDIVYGARDIYAYIDGKRYELTYVDDGDLKITTFILQDDNNEVAVGSFANIVLEKKDCREDVVTVPKEAVYGTLAERYVYVIRDGKPVKTVIKAGASDDVYTEIRSGVEEGELVQVPAETAVKGSKERKLIVGKTNREFNGVATEYFPVKMEVKTPQTNVSIYFVEYLVDKHSYVKKGYPIARIRVEASSLEVDELEVEIQRAKERLQDTIDSKPEEMSEESEKAFEESVQASRDSIAEKEALLAEMREARLTTAIYAPISGYVEDLKWFPGETLLSPNEAIATVCSSEYVYLTASDTFDFIHLGEVARTDIVTTPQNYVQGQVVSLDNWGLSPSLHSSKTFIKIRRGNDAYGFGETQMDDLYKLNEILKTIYKGTARSIKVTMTNVVMENAILVPKEAVKQYEGCTYVNVLQEDGTTKLVSFIAGGNAKMDDFFWAIEGLEEGMIVCWE